MRPPKILETIAALFIPPSCREEILGDLFERYRSPRQYILDALHAIPLVIWSKVRRNSDGQVVLIQALSLYLSYLAAAWFQDRSFLNQQWDLLRLAIPAGATLFGLLLDDAYADRERSAMQTVVRGPIIGSAFSLLMQGLLWTAKPELAIPRWTMLYGCAASLVISSTVRMLFPSTSELQSANAPASLLTSAQIKPGVIAIAILWMVVVGCQLWIRG